MRFLLPALLLPLLAALLICGCNRAQSAAQAPPPSDVQYAVAKPKSITDFEEFTGRTEAVASVDVRARVTGYLWKVLFKEGADVEKNQELFDIDPRTYQAEYARAAASVQMAQSRLRRSEEDLKRAQTLLPSKVIAQEDYDRYVDERVEAEAGVRVAEAARDLTKQNLDWTRVTAPIGGRIGRQMIDAGNMVKADDTVLTSIVSTDPIYVYFDVDERTVQRISRLPGQATTSPTSEADPPEASQNATTAPSKKVEEGARRILNSTVYLAIADETGFPHAGKVDFVDNKLDAMTGTLRVRGLFKNPTGLLAAGMFARIRLPIGELHDALLISERALGSDQGQRYVYLIGEKNDVVYRRVKVGALVDGLRVIEDGIGPEDKVIVSGLQRVRPGAIVKPNEVDMATLEPIKAPGTTRSTKSKDAEMPSTQGEAAKTEEK